MLRPDVIPVGMGVNHAIARTRFQKSDLPGELLRIIPFIIALAKGQICPAARLNQSKPVRMSADIAFRHDRDDAVRKTFLPINYDFTRAVRRKILTDNE